MSQVGQKQTSPVQPTNVCIGTESRLKSETSFMSEMCHEQSFGEVSVIGSCADFAVIQI